MGAIFGGLRPPGPSNKHPRSTPRSTQCFRRQLTDALKKIDGIKIYGEAPDKTAVISFNVGEIHPYDLGSILDQLGIAVRTGHHCAQPIMGFFEIPGTVRASFSFYNTFEEIDRFIAGIQKALLMLQ